MTGLTRPRTHSGVPSFMPMNPNDCADLATGVQMIARLRMAAVALVRLRNPGWGPWGGLGNSRSETHRHEDEVRRMEQLGLPLDSSDSDEELRRTERANRVTPMDFVQAMKWGHFGDVTTDQDSKRVMDTLMEAAERGADGAMIGFALPGRPTRVVWADFEVFWGGDVPPDELPD